MVSVAHVFATIVALLNPSSLSVGELPEAPGSLAMATELGRESSGLGP